MTAPTEVKVPDIGDFDNVPVIEVHVSIGDQVNAEDPLVTLESDKATLDVPAPAAGSVADVLVKIGDEVSEGTPILLLIPATARSRPSLSRRAAGTAAVRAGTDACGRTGRRSGHGAGTRSAAGAHAGRRRDHDARQPARRAERAPDGARAGSRPRAVVPRPGRRGGSPRTICCRSSRDQPSRLGHGASCRGRRRDPGDPRAGLLQVRPDRDGVAVADQEDVGAVPAPIVAERPARDP